MGRVVQAGDKEHVGEGSVSERADASWSNQELSHYLVCVVEADAQHPSSSSQDALGSQAAPADVEIGVVAVEISTGDVLYGQFRCSTLSNKLLPLANEARHYAMLMQCVQSPGVGYMI